MISIMCLFQITFFIKISVQVGFNQYFGCFNHNKYKVYWTLLGCHINAPNDSLAYIYNRVSWNQLILSHTVWRSTRAGEFHPQRPARRSPKRCSQEPELPVLHHIGSPGIEKKNNLIKMWEAFSLVEFLEC